MWKALVKEDAINNAALTKKFSLGIMDDPFRFCDKKRKRLYLYVYDLVAFVARPVLELKTFSKVEIAAGAPRVVRIPLSASVLEFYDKDLRPVVEPSEFTLLMGVFSWDIRLCNTFEIFSPK